MDRLSSRGEGRREEKSFPSKLLNESFGKQNRLGKATSTVIKKGKRASCDCLTIYYRSGRGKRFSVVVSKKIGNSVKRNRLKRWGREIFRREKQRLKKSDIVLIYNMGARNCIFWDVEKALKSIWKKESLYRN